MVKNAEKFKNEILLFATFDMSMEGYDTQTHL